MARLGDVARYVRSKNAGPFWVTIDIFFASAQDFARYAVSPALTPENVASALGLETDSMRRYDVTEIAVLKYSYPRMSPQGGALERDMHSGQVYVPLLDIEI